MKFAAVMVTLGTLGMLVYGWLGTEASAIIEIFERISAALLSAT